MMGEDIINYYWISQKDEAYNNEVNGKEPCLQGGILDKRGVDDWKDMDNLKIGDITINCRSKGDNSIIRAIGIVQEETIKTSDSRTTKVTYYKLVNPVKYDIEKNKEFRKKELEDKEEICPFDKRGYTKEGYIHSLGANSKVVDYYLKKIINSNPEVKIFLKDTPIRLGLVKSKDYVPFRSKNVVLYGPPGTGKTRKAKIEAIKIVFKAEGFKHIFEALGLDEKAEDSVWLKMAEKCIEGNKQFGRMIRFVQFHPSYSYHDFMETVDVSGGYKDKVFKEIAQEAKNNPQKNYVLIIDEINRANVSDVLGELLYGLEYRNAEFTTSIRGMQKDQEPFSVPENLYIIGTMNTADRSLQTLDYAVRRRFAFERIDSEPPKKQEGKFYETDDNMFFMNALYKVVKDDIKNSVARDVDSKDIMPGISYFLVNKDGDQPDSGHLMYKIEYQLIPLLREYAKDGMFTNRNVLKTVDSIISDSSAMTETKSLMDMLKDHTYLDRMKDVINA